MENRMRDLEHIQERSSDSRGHPVGSVLLAVLTVLGFTFSMGVVVGRAANPEEESAEDPLARLDRNEGLHALDEGENKATPDIKRDELTFPTVLTDHEDRPEVKAALAAAAAEEADLEAAALAVEPFPAEKEKPERPQPVATQKIATALPAAVAAGRAAGKLARAAEESDPLLSAAISAPKDKSPAPAGREGAFTLQIASYEQPGAAQAFAKGLRARGHQTFVTSADIPGRGRFWRVRIGPFDTKWEAQAYREKFEEQERMNTFVVRRRD
jgi:DedD protein